MNTFCIAKDRKKANNYRKRRTFLKHSSKKLEKNQTLLPFYKKDHFIINSNKNSIKNEISNDKIIPFFNFVSNKSIFSKNKYLNLKDQNLFKICESKDFKNEFDSIEKKEYNKGIELGTNDITKNCFMKVLSDSHLKNESINKNIIKNKKHNSQENTSTIFENKSEEPIITQRIKRRKIISSNSNTEDDSQIELENEVCNLDKRYIIEERTRGSKRNSKKTVFQKQLQKLKQKKNKISKRTLESDSDDLEIINNLRSSLGNSSNLTFSYSETSQSDQESASLDDFIVDDNEIIGEPSLEMPVEFTTFSYQGILSHFKIFIQYRIHKLLNPNFIEEESKHFIFSLKYLERRFNSLRDSVLSSSAWKSPFVNALSSRPILKTGTCETRFLCDACNISGRASIHWVQFHGPKYHFKTLEIYENKEEQEELLKNKINDSNETWYLGRFCYIRAKIAHRFWHWNFNINEDLKKVLKKHGKFDESFKKTFLNTDIPQRIKKVDNIIKELDNSGGINDIWENFNNTLKQAEDFMIAPSRFKKKEY
ncbi:hypothetical protein PCANB_001992 [Pneumocystis canis]|nr:hypothetical protein PCANB_001992 [Pneumocystis canis]